MVTSQVSLELSSWVGCQVWVLGFDAGKNSRVSQGEGL